MFQTVSALISSERKFRICDPKLLRLFAPYFELLQLFTHDLAMCHEKTCPVKNILHIFSFNLFEFYK